MFGVKLPVSILVSSLYLSLRYRLISFQDRQASRQIQEKLLVTLRQFNMPIDRTATQASALYKALKGRVLLFRLSFTEVNLSQTRNESKSLTGYLTYNT